MKLIVKYIMCFSLIFACLFGCISCGIVDKVKKKGCEHVYDEISITIAATCTNDGELTKMCTNCGDKQIEIIPKLGHSSKDVDGVAANCYRTGLTRGRICVRCNTVLSGMEEISALGHDFTDSPFACGRCTMEVFDFFKNDDYYKEVDFENGDYVCGNYYRIYRPTYEEDVSECACQNGCFGFHGLEVFPGTPYIGVFMQKTLDESNNNADTCFYESGISQMNEWTWEGDFAIRFYIDYVDIYFGVCTFYKNDDTATKYYINYGTTASIALGSVDIVKQLVVL